MYFLSRNFLKEIMYQKKKIREEKRKREMKEEKNKTKESKRKIFCGQMRLSLMNPCVTIFNDLKIFAFLEL